MTRTSFAFAALCTLLWPEQASAFCGFYVTGADTSLYANATMTVLMRDGTRTVLSMQNNYQGPPDAFALVIPVPAVLQKDQVKILPKDIFQKVDALGAPRLVEYWETDPCAPVPQYSPRATAATPPPAAAGNTTGGSVRVEAQFTVGEYEVVILSADNSSALDTWLRDNKYNIPAGAEPVLKPYVSAGMKFFVAKVDPQKVTFEKGQAALSPLRFHYDTPEFSLPVRLGLLNSQGSQDLIVNILARQRYELANYPNATVPTNIRVQDEVRNDFGSFYEALFSRVLEKKPGAVVTEYSWASGSCDPCPTPPLGPQEIATLGGDVLDPNASTPSGGNFSYSLTLTRLHARYTKDNLGDDLVFKQAPSIVGGRGIPDTKGNLDQSVMEQSGGSDNFQGRYVILHPWEKELSCQNPTRGRWGGPSGTPGSAPMSMGSTNGALKGTPPKAGDLANLLAESVPALAVDAKRPLAPLGGNSSAKPAPGGSGEAGKSENGAGATAAAGSGTTAAGSGSSSTPNAPAARRKSSACSAVHLGSHGSAGWVSALLALAALRFRWRRRERRSLRSAVVTRASVAFTALCALAWPDHAAAFCGFYVTGANSNLYANATMTVLMRDGTRTVLSMQNNYQGPPDAFALVIPVPSVLQKEQVKILPKDIFQKVDALGAPRLVEYWETDPCEPLATDDGVVFSGSAAANSGAATPRSAVRVEAQFTVGEYEVVVLSADDSSALDTWLRENKYNIPADAEPVLKPYVSAGMKFFVAKVDPQKVTFEKGQAVLSPLRFHYDTPDFSLPVRLGLLNSQGSQDLIVNILARQRYELANYPNATVPTNIRVQDEVRNDFGSFYEALFSRVLKQKPGAVVTEYSWSAGSCDPCPTPPLGEQEIATLGGDVLNSNADPSNGLGLGYSLTLTRLHARYTKDNLGEDLVFKQAPSIVGGRGVPDAKGNLDQSVQTQSGGVDNFQGRYVILHPWEKAQQCVKPTRGRWGGPSGTQGSAPMSMGSTNSALSGAPPKAGDLANLLAESVPSLGVDAKRPVAPLDPKRTKPAAADSGSTNTSDADSDSSSCRAVLAGSRGGAGWVGVLLALATLSIRRRRQGRS